MRLLMNGTIKNSLAEKCKKATSTAVNGLTDSRQLLRNLDIVGSKLANFGAAEAAPQYMEAPLGLKISSPEGFHVLSQGSRPVG